jgi:hypothetical protein
MEDVQRDKGFEVDQVRRPSVREEKFNDTTRLWGSG